MNSRIRAEEWISWLRRAMVRERERIARLLHDEVGQILSAAGLQMDLLRMDCQHIAGVGQRITDTQKLLERALAQVRDLSYDLNPAIVERLGLEGALARLVARHRTAFRGQLSWSYRGDPQTRGTQAQALYRIAEEALQNAIQHAEATDISLTAEATASALKLEVRDNGCGFRTEQVLGRTPAVGLRLMKLEAETAGMDFRLASEPQGGTIVTVVWPPAGGAREGGSRTGRAAKRSQRR